MTLYDSFKQYKRLHFLKIYLSRFVRRVFSRIGYNIAPINVSGVVPLDIWLSDEKFLSVWNNICNNTMLDISRGYVIYQLLDQVAHLEGAVAEIGVWRGGIGQLMNELLPHKKIYLFDTFEGLPNVSPQYDGHFHCRGQFNDTSYESVVKLFSEYQNVGLIKGVFPNSIKDCANLSQEFSFIHVDVDLYQSAADACEYFYPRLVRGGAMIFDDYGFATCPGVKLAVDVFFENKKGHFYIPTGQYIVFKI